MSDDIHVTSADFFVLPPQAALDSLDKSIAARWELLNDLYAPMGEDGERHPEAGVISREAFLQLLEAPAARSGDEKE